MRRNDYNSGSEDALQLQSSRELLSVLNPRMAALESLRMEPRHQYFYKLLSAAIFGEPLNQKIRRK